MKAKIVQPLYCTDLARSDEMFRNIAGQRVDVIMVARTGEAIPFSPTIIRAFTRA